MSEDGRMKAIPFMSSFLVNYRETMPWASEKPYIYSVMENTCNEAKLYNLDETGKEIVIENVLFSMKYALGGSSTTAMHGHLPNTGKQEKERRTCRDYLKYEESKVRIKSESISKKKNSNYSSFQDLRSSCNEDMVKYEGPRPSTTRARTLNEKSNKKIPPATSQPPGWRVCRPAEQCAARQEAVSPGSWSPRFSFHSRRNLNNQEGSRPSKPTLDTPLGPETDIKL
ncbi:hypothetical protein Tco_0682484 [Tanacetum coccineum]|uniref:Uncharacterized protein n=1 Tax=Tanacetum coccineum TaxID=301880 RepID=A0ABQ4XRJ3_9ASTR